MQRNRIISIILSLMLIISLSSCTTTKINNDGSNELIVWTENGNIEGFSEDGVRKFFGVPFAQPPVGDLRFAPPQDTESWDDTLDCTEKKPSALQNSDDETAKYSEDCLYLNVWAPEGVDMSEPLPVLVFIHGGAFAFGSPNLEKYDGTRFAQDKVIQVNVAYRLNALGFTTFDEVENEYGYAGNMGLLDQIKALEWVQANIQHFGGDEENVTVCGESAGSMSISDLLLAPEASELFSKAIMQSGTSLTQSVIAPYASGDEYYAKESTKKLMDAVGADSIEEMREVDADELVKNSSFSIDMTKQTEQYFFPVFDDKLIPEDPYRAVVEGEMNDVDILTGFNTDEGSIFIPDGVTEEEYQTYMERSFGTYAEKVMEKYPIDSENSPTDRLRQIVKICLSVGSQVYGDALADRGYDVFLYEYAYTTPEYKKQGLGAHHGMELEFVFDTLSENLQDDTSNLVKEDIHNRWLNFIVNSDPNKGIEVNSPWPEFKAGDKQILKLDAEPSIETSPLTDDLEFMKSILWD